MKNLIFTLISVFLTFSVWSRSAALDSALVLLDRAIAANAENCARRDADIEQAKAMRLAASTPEAEYIINERIISLYDNYQSDSLLHYLDRNIELARKIGNTDFFNRAAIKRVYVLTILSVLHEALTEFELIDSTTVSDKDLVDYYITSTNLYRVLRDESRDNELREAYDKKSNQSRLTLLEILDPNSNEYLHRYADQLYYEGRSAEGDSLYRELAMRADSAGAKAALYLYNYSFLKAREAGHDEQLRYFALSAMADLKYCTRENAALGTLANALAADGDFDRASRYIHEAYNDADRFNTSYRKMQITPSMTSIDAAIRMQEQRRHERTTALMWFTVIGLIIVGILLVILYHSVKRTRRLNERLRKSYVNERQTNARLNEANVIKEECIKSFLSNGIENLESLERYRQNVLTKLNAKQYKELADMAKGTAFARTESDTLYNNFDSVVLKIYPHFVDEFNALLAPDKQIKPRSSGSLTPELRIFALIRLGVDSSADIARYLRYSMSTIYNYRVKVRKSCRLDISPDDFEGLVKQIGAL